MKCALENGFLPVANVDRAKAFYGDVVGFHLDVDHSAGPGFRIVQLTPPGSSCSVTVMRNPEAAGSVQGLHLVVEDIVAAREDPTSRGAEVSDYVPYGAQGQEPGLVPQRADYATFLSFADPDGNSWLVQDVPSRPTDPAHSGAPSWHFPSWHFPDLISRRGLRPASSHARTTSAAARYLR